MREGPEDFDLPRGPARLVAIPLHYILASVFFVVLSSVCYSLLPIHASSVRVSFASGFVYKYISWVQYVHLLTTVVSVAG